MQGIIHHIEINVSNLERSIHFWEWLLIQEFNYVKSQQWDKGVCYKLADSYIAFVQTEKEYLNHDFHRKRTGLNHIAFHCESKEFVNKLTIELKKRNVPVLYEDKHPFAGGKNYYAVFFEDPDKIKVEVVVQEKI